MSPQIYIRAAEAKRLRELVDQHLEGRDGATAERLGEELDRATIVDDAGVPSDVVAIGSRVRFEDEQSGKGPGDLSSSVPPQALEDARAAVRLVRARGRDWNIDPNRVGLLGFSAGAMTTLGVALTVPRDEQPAFIAPIYPPMNAQVVPSSAPPMFVALASDDPLFGSKGFGLVESWQAAKRPVELHYFQKSGHGFGQGVAGTTTEGWLDGFVRWLTMNAFLRPEEGR